MSTLYSNEEAERITRITKAVKSAKERARARARIAAEAIREERNLQKTLTFPIEELTRC
jgi:L-aminopeptidase/D-esterase-like protein